MTVASRRLEPPRFTGRMAGRPRLVARVLSAAPIVLAEAPSGFGKTALLAALAQAEAPGAIAWASFAAGDEAAQVLELLVAALAPAGFGGGDLDGLLGAVEAQGAPRTLLLDDLHLPTEAARRGILAPLLARRPPGLRIIGAGRRLDGLRLAKLRAGGEAAVLGADVLALADADVEELCAGLSRRQVREVAALAAGWPLAARVLADHLRGGGAAAWSRTGVLDYLEEEVAAELAPLDRERLVLCALLEPIDRAGLARLAAIDEAEAARTLARLARPLAGLVRPAADGLEVAPALRAWLVEHLGKRPGEQRAFAARTAARAAAEQGRTARAVAIAAGAGESDLALELVSACGGLTLWLNRGMDEVRAVLRAAGPDLIGRSSTLQLMHAVAHLKQGGIPEAVALAEAAARAAPPGDHNLDVVRVALLVYGCRVPGPDEARAFEALTAFAVREPAWLAFVLSAQCLLELQAGRFEAAILAAHGALAAARPEALAYAELFLDYHLAGVAIARGESRQARERLRHGRGILRMVFPTDEGAETIGAVESAELDYELGRLASARARIRIVAPRLERMEAWFDIYAAAFETAARLVLHDEGLAAARLYLATNRQSLRRRQLGRVADVLEAIEAMICGEAQAQSGEPAPAERSALTTPPFAGWREREAFGLAQAYAELASGAGEAALESLGRLIAEADAGGAARPALRAHLLRSRVLDRIGRPAQSQAALEAALDIGARTAFRRAFIDFGGPAVLARLRPVTLTNDERGRFARLVLGQAEAPRAAAADVRLTAREQEILMALEGGGSDKALGRRLGVTEHAVRFHLKNAFRKLEAHSRLEALDRARRLGVLDPP